MMVALLSSSSCSQRRSKSYYSWLILACLFSLNVLSFLTTTITSFILPPSYPIRHKLSAPVILPSDKARTTNLHLTGDENGNAVNGEYRSAAGSSSLEFRSSSIPNEPNTVRTNLYNVSLLVIDHYDSFTYNLCDMLAQQTIRPPVVLAKDAMENTEDALEFLQQFDGIIVSPGPGSPEEQPLLSSLAFTQNPNLPILGVCLGHQIMAHAYGGRVIRAPVPIHGQDHEIVVNEESQAKETKNDVDHSSTIYPSLFRELPENFRVVRYHSLCANDESLPRDALTVTARTPHDNVIQAIQHQTNPHYGVQFHPESIGTENGMQLLENFLQVVQEQKLQKQQQSKSAENEDASQPLSTTSLSSHSNSPKSSSSPSSQRFKVMVHPIQSTSTITPLQAFETFYAQESHSIWLDSSSFRVGRGTLDILAAPSRSEDVLEYHQNDNNGKDDDILSQLEVRLFEKGKNPSTKIGWVTLEDDKYENHLLQWIEEEEINDDTTKDLPFHYRGGFLGFLGYEVRHDTQRYLLQQQQQQQTEEERNEAMDHPNRSRINRNDDDKHRTPAAAFFLARQSMVYHHPTSTWYLIGLVEEENDIQENLDWMKQMDAEMSDLEERNDLPEQLISSASNYQARNGVKSVAASIEFLPNRPKSTYENDIAKCHEHIRKGDSYELCLTNQLEATITRENISTFDLYKIIREVNPAPYSSYFRWNLQSKAAADEASPTSLAICSSSPERFMSVSRIKKANNGETATPESYLRAEAKPIKGTCARVMPSNGVCRSEDELEEDNRLARSLESSLKNRAENLMIVDLLRNDISRVCQTGSVHVPKLMDIESFETVHQMVSTIRGNLDDSNNCIDLLRASFPGGSMTGAPKLRTMELLEELEEGIDRGPYSGSLGYLSVNGCMDMNILIRSAVVAPSEENKNEWRISIGAGGAITVLSDAEDEYSEMLLKASAVKQAVQRWAANTNSKVDEFGHGNSGVADSSIESLLHLDDDGMAMMMI